MKINLPFQYQLKINKQYKPVKVLLPIGCDCHPAYMLTKLELRKESLPFDWLDTEPHLALNYAYSTLHSQFDFFLSDLAKNEQSKVFSQKHPEALFYHFDDLIENKDLQLKIAARSKRFLELFKQNPCYFVHTIPSVAFRNKENLDFIIESVSKFTTLLKTNDELLIYLRFDESLGENRQYAEVLENALQTFPQVKWVSYIRNKDKFGIWGDETKYRQLINQLGIQTKMAFPKISFLKK